MEVYVAARESDVSVAREVMTAFNRASHTIGFDWTAPPDVGSGEKRDAAIASLRAQGLRRSRVLVVVSGSHFELGFAIALGIPVVVVEQHVSWNPEDYAGFDCHPLVHRGKFGEPMELVSFVEAVVATHDEHCARKYSELRGSGAD